MTQFKAETERKIRIINELGLHARPAGLIAQIAKKAKTAIWIIRNGEKKDASDMLDVLTLACGKGTEVTLKAENPDDMDSLDEIEEILKKDFSKTETEKQT
jgi:phosphocarrier protein HPr